MVRTRIILYLCIFGIQIEQRRKIKKTKYKRERKTRKKIPIIFLFFYFVCVYHTGVSESIRDRKRNPRMQPTHPLKHTRTHGRASIRRKNRERERDKKDIVWLQQSNNPRLVIFTETAIISLVVNYTDM